MNYFVSIGNSYSHDWQIELLIKSFKLLNLDKNLFIAKSDSKFYNSNRYYLFPNLGKQKEYLKYNKWYGLYNLIKSKIISLPVVVLEPHTVLVKPITKECLNQSNITFQIDSKFAFNEFKDIYNLEISNFWLNIGDTIIFDEIKEDFFYKILENIETNSLYLDNFYFLDKLAIFNTILENIKNLKINRKLNLECYLKQNDLNYILNYKNGFDNKFNKNFYTNKNFNMCDQDIKNTLSNIRFTKCLDFLYNIF